MLIIINENLFLNVFIKNKEQSILSPGGTAGLVFFPQT